MRSSSVKVLGIVLASLIACSPASAKIQGVIFGDVYCEQPTTCIPTVATMPKLISDTAACVQKHFGISQNPFVSSQTLDTDNCLQTDPSAVSSSSAPSASLKMVPQCCVINTGKTCTVQCQLIGVH